MADQGRSNAATVVSESGEHSSAPDSSSSSENGNSEQLAVAAAGDNPRESAYEEDGEVFPNSLLQTMLENNYNGVTVIDYPSHEPSDVPESSNGVDESSNWVAQLGNFQRLVRWRRSRPNIIRAISAAEWRDIITSQEVTVAFGGSQPEVSDKVIHAHLRQRKYEPTEDGSPAQGDQCCICQEEYIAGEDVGSLDCSHNYHVECITRWLHENNTCPICKRIGLAAIERDG